MDYLSPGPLGHPGLSQHTPGSAPGTSSLHGPSSHLPVSQPPYAYPTPHSHHAHPHTHTHTHTQALGDPYHSYNMYPSRHRSAATLYRGGTASPLSGSGHAGHTAAAHPSHRSGAHDDHLWHPAASASSPSGHLSVAPSTTGPPASGSAAAGRPEPYLMKSLGMGAMPRRSPRSALGSGGGAGGGSSSSSSSSAATPHLSKDTAKGMVTTSHGSAIGSGLGASGAFGFGSGSRSAAPRPAMGFYNAHEAGDDPAGGSGGGGALTGTPFTSGGMGSRETGASDLPLHGAFGGFGGHPAAVAATPHHAAYAGTSPGDPHRSPAAHSRSPGAMTSDGFDFIPTQSRMSADAENGRTGRFGAAPRPPLPAHTAATAATATAVPAAPTSPPSPARSTPLANAARRASTPRGVRLFPGLYADAAGQRTPWRPPVVPSGVRFDPTPYAVSEMAQPARRDGANAGAGAGVGGGRDARGDGNGDGDDDDPFRSTAGPVRRTPSYRLTVGRAHAGTSAAPSPLAPWHPSHPSPFKARSSDRGAASIAASASASSSSAASAAQVGRARYRALSTSRRPRGQLPPQTTGRDVPDDALIRVAPRPWWRRLRESLWRVYS
ncbi:hypothetical protein CXG81DRAFT_24793 [Caulochytrium protostelioides]|uniref:Uncharacterized protein n=1 Tax=Caulochytrium protostelioides TaxID=1555241 RepID=A0A4P9XB15_9FUNG|nr:hypothetical protein CXG81DRAFT_24793 [Caulochytrium protostelioides]|eukprot:RKP02578.1 hypothetical protein CXG81DRAFT_24793 [Caulochytrium protostelioides]